MFFSQKRVKYKKTTTCGLSEAKHVVPPSQPNVNKNSLSWLVRDFYIVIN